MERAAIIFMALTALLPTPSSDAGSDTGTLSQDGSATVILGANSPQTTAINWALGRFEDVGIPLPTLQITVYGSRAGCGNHDGLFTPSDGVDRIDLCSDAPLILLHELAHAWDINFGTDDTRQVMLDAWGSDRWSGGDVGYRQRGEEKAASLIALGLIDSTLTESEAVTSRAMLERFEMLTGVPSPRYDGTLSELIRPTSTSTAGLAAQYAARAQAMSR